MNSSLIPHTSDTSPTAAVPNKRHQVGITTLGFPTRIVMHLPLVVPILSSHGQAGYDMALSPPGPKSHYL
jgi:hypothetical protein